MNQDLILTKMNSIIRQRFSLGKKYKKFLNKKEIKKAEEVNLQILNCNSQLQQLSKQFFEV